MTDATNYDTNNNSLPINQWKQIIYMQHHVTHANHSHVMAKIRSIIRCKQSQDWTEQSLMSYNAKDQIV